jgi:hypothetical protein
MKYNGTLPIDAGDTNRLVVVTTPLPLLESWRISDETRRSFVSADQDLHEIRYSSGMRCSRWRELTDYG